MEFELNKTDTPVEKFSLRKSGAFNLPNRLTLSRLVLAIIFFVFLSYNFYDTALAFFFWRPLLIGWMDIMLESRACLQTWAVLRTLLSTK